jgi:hypothetical protein
MTDGNGVILAAKVFLQGCRLHCFLVVLTLRATGASGAPPG